MTFNVVYFNIKIKRIDMTGPWVAQGCHNKTVSQR